MADTDRLQASKVVGVAGVAGMVEPVDIKRIACELAAAVVTVGSLASAPSASAGDGSGCVTGSKVR